MQEELPLKDKSIFSLLAWLSGALKLSQSNHSTLYFDGLKLSSIDYYDEAFNLYEYINHYKIIMHI